MGEGEAEVLVPPIIKGITPTKIHGLLYPAVGVYPVTNPIPVTIVLQENGVRLALMQAMMGIIATADLTIRTNVTL